MDGDNFRELDPRNITPDLVGLKAYGLLCIPEVWTKSFFVVVDGAVASQSLIEKAGLHVGFIGNARVLVRSSGVNESIDSRGSLISADCNMSDVSSEIAKLKNKLQELNSLPSSPVHWVVQLLSRTIAKGHLSNERRLSLHLRDWVAEVEVTPGHAAENHRIAIRTWRKALTSSPSPLHCAYRVAYINSLNAVARWAYERQIRVHFEWVWDGDTVFIVQADDCEAIPDGVDPKSLVNIPIGKVQTGKLEVFRLATTADFTSYRKLANAQLYRGLGYNPVNFYVLDDEDEIAHILSGHFSNRLKADLRTLTIRPLVIRTDGKKIPEGSRQMLPRSDELRSDDAAVEWLQSFKVEIAELKLADCKLCLVAHHFIPAAASAWCQAHPTERRVRIESLWGIPEGLYWYAYDVFDVDTNSSVIATNQDRPSGMRIRERLRFKERFIAPDASGAWVLHKTGPGPDWNSSIHHTRWIEEIAWTSRQIANVTGHSVVVMWFIDIPGKVSRHNVIPWYHERWSHEATSFKAAPRKKFSSSNEFTVHTTNDWHTLNAKAEAGAYFSRVVINPTEPELVRDQQFAKALAHLAKQHQFVVELSGGILSHAYYMLSSSGCAVECVDLDDYANEDEEVKFNKLVRDKIPDSIMARGENVAVYKLDGEALIAALRTKLIEEAFEVADAKTTVQISEELADVREVMAALTKKLEISDEMIEKIRREKNKKRGAFEDGWMLAKTSLASSLKQKEEDLGGIIEIASSTEIQTIFTTDQLPPSHTDLHIDKRQDSTGTLERQFTITLPAHASGFQPGKSEFVLETQQGVPHEMTLEISLERDGADLRCRLRLRNIPIQTQLSLFDERK